MPRELLQILKFNSGIIGTVDEEDIPNDAASFALETDADTLPGKLTPRYTDSAVADPVVENAVVSAFIVNDDGKYDLVYYDADEGDFTRVQDFYGTTSKADLSATEPGTGKTVAMQVHNKAVHIGWGNDSSSPAKWVGRINYKPFGDVTVTDLQYLDAELKPPSTAPYLYKICGADNTYIYGIEWKGSKIYRIKVSDGTISESSETFASTQGICEFMVDGSGDYLFVYDKDGPFGTVYKFNKTTMLISERYNLTGFGAATYYPGAGGASNTGYEVSDIELSADSSTTQKLWFGAGWREDGAKAGTIDTKTATTFGYIYRLSGTLVAGTDYVPSALNPLWSNYTGVAGAEVDGEWEHSASLIFQPIKRCFVKTCNAHAGEIVFLADFSDTACRMSTGGVSTLKQVNMGGVVMNGSTAQGDYLNAANCRLFQISSTGSTKYTGGIYVKDSFDARNGGLLSGKDSTANAFFYGVNWSIAGMAWAAGLFKTITTGMTQAKYGDMTNTCIAKRDNVNDATSYVYWEHALSGVSRGIYATLGVGGLAFGAPTYKLYGFGLTATKYTDGRGQFDTGKRYYYKCSIEYDKLQESPLFVTIPTQYDPASATDSAQITITIPTALTPSYRSTAIKIYRAESADTLYQPETLYRLVDSIPIADTFWSSASSSWGTVRTRTLTDIGIYQASYESETEISESNETNHLNYKVSTQLQGFHFVAQAYSSAFGNDLTGSYLFRSKQNRFNQFDILNDFLILPKPANALAAWAGSIWAFADNEMYRINPQGLFIEDIIQGIGCNWNTGVMVTSEGMFWGDKNNLYQHNGQTITPIGEPIKVIQNSNGSGYGYRSRITGYVGMYLSVVPFRKYGYILFCTLGGPLAVSAITPQIYAYHLASQSWHIWTAGANSDIPHGVFSGKSGEVYLSGDSGLLSIADSGSRASMTWYSRDLTLDEPSAKKSFVDLNIHNASGSNTTTVSFDDAAFGAFSALTRAKKMQIKVTGTGIIEAIGLVFRRIRGYTSANT